MVPLPVKVDPPGEAVMVQVPVEGNPLNSTFEGVVHVGFVTAPIIGEDGTDGAGLMVTPGEEAAELHPAWFVTE